MQRLEVSGAVRPIYRSLRFKRLKDTPWCRVSHIPLTYMTFDAEAESTQYSLHGHSKKSLPAEVSSATLIHE